MLKSTEVPLTQAYDLAMLDLDGVVYVGSAAVPTAPAAIERVRDAGMRVAFITNNASRTPDIVSDHLERIGVPARMADVVTSAQAAARVLADRFPAGSRVFMCGGRGLDVALREVGLKPVEDLTDDPVAIATGYGPTLPWQAILNAAIGVADGIPWVATNTDMTIPTDLGIGPGHGAVVDLLRRHSGREPIAIGGKPARPLLDETIRRMGAERPLMVGDRLDTDIEGAANAGIDSLLVMTGVTGLADLAGTPPQQRPTYIAPDLNGLLAAQPPVRVEDGVAWVGTWRARVDDGRLLVETTCDGRSNDAGDWWRASAGALWAHLDRTGSAAAVDGVSPPA